jgi:hypothetical protein
MFIDVAMTLNTHFCFFVLMEQQKKSLDRTFVMSYMHSDLLPKLAQDGCVIYVPILYVL